MSCDGTPGNPGLERVGDELYTCTGCSSCKVPSAEEMAAQLGVNPAEVTDAITAQIGMYTEMMRAMAEKLKPAPTPSRAHRRAMKHGHPTLYGNYGQKRSH